VPLVSSFLGRVPLRGGADAEFLANVGEGPSGAAARFPLGSSGLSTFRRKEPKKLPGSLLVETAQRKRVLMLESHR
jgi:hypothetical protein